MRVAAIIDKGRSGDKAAEAFAWEIVGLLMASEQGSDYKDSMGRSYPFSTLSLLDRVRARTVGIEHVCDRSIPLLGGWLL
jgi:hypothetical protein